MSYLTWSFATAVLLTSGVTCRDWRPEGDQETLQTPAFEQAPTGYVDQLKIKVETNQGMKLKSHGQTIVKATGGDNQIKMNEGEIPHDLRNDLRGFDVTENDKSFSEKAQKTQEMRFEVQLLGNMENKGTTINENNIQIKTGGIQRENEKDNAPSLWTKRPYASPGESEEGSPNSILPRSITNPQLNKEKSVKWQQEFSDAVLQAKPNHTIPRTASKSPPDSKMSFGKGWSFLRGVFGSSFGRKSSRFKSISSKTYPNSPSQPSYYRPRIPGLGEEGVPSKGNTVYTDFIKRVKSQVGGSSDHGEEVVTRRGNTRYTDYIERIKSQVAKNGNIN